MNENTNNGGALVQATTNPPAETRVMRPATVEELKEQVKVIQQCMKSLMKEKTHFDCLPGCGDKKTLLKPGAELILTLFRFSAEPIIERETDGFDISYRITVVGRHIFSGNIVGYGVGECSTSEKKYKWREAVCQKEYDVTPETRRQIAFIKRFNKQTNKSDVIEVLQVRQNPADLENTILKMAKKRAIVDFCLTATACSDIFVQDLDDPDIGDAVNEGNKASGGQPQGGRYAQPRQSAPQQNAANGNQQQQRTAPPATTQSAPVYNNGGGNISEAQVKRLYAIAKHESRNLNDEEISFIVWSIAGVQRADQISREAYNAVITGIEAAKHGSVLPAEDGSMF